MGSFNLSCSISSTDFDECLKPEVVMMVTVNIGGYITPYSMLFNATYYACGRFEINENQPAVDMAIEKINKHLPDFTVKDLESICDGNQDTTIEIEYGKGTLSVFAVHKSVFDFIMNSSYENWDGKWNRQRIRQDVIDNLVHDVEYAETFKRELRLSNHNYYMCDKACTAGSIMELFERVGMVDFGNAIVDMNWLMLYLDRRNIKLIGPVYCGQGNKYKEDAEYLRGLADVVEALLPVEYE